MADNVQCKTAVNTRASLESRLPKKTKSVEQPSAALHQKAETTYDATYTAVQGERTRPVYCGAPGAAASAVDAEFASGEGQRTAAGVSLGEERDQRGYTTHYHPSAGWESTSHAASRNVQPVRQLDFYANVRKLEQADDDQRGGLVGSTQRSLEIRTKRAEDATLRPASPSYPNTQRRTIPPVVEEERFGAKRNYLDIVECTQLKPLTEEQMGYRDAPLARLPGGTLSQDVRVQSKVITEMSTSRDFYRGTAKYLKDTPVGYSGHVPQADRNLAAIHHGEDAQRMFAKSHMTLAVHGGGVALPPSGPSASSRRSRGRNTTAPKALPPRSVAAINQTAQGHVQQLSLYGTLERERQMNIRDDHQGQNYF